MCCLAGTAISAIIGPPMRCVREWLRFAEAKIDPVSEDLSMSPESIGFLASALLVAGKDNINASPAIKDRVSLEKEKEKEKSTRITVDVCKWLRSTSGGKLAWAS